jgi:hypothetical protein
MTPLVFRAHEFGRVSQASVLGTLETNTLTVSGITATARVIRATGDFR